MGCLERAQLLHEPVVLGVGQGRAVQIGAAAIALVVRRGEPAAAGTRRQPAIEAARMT
jgi:hypothetical protein